MTAPVTRHSSLVTAPVPPELARRGITGARHEMPAGMEVSCARDLVLIFGAEVRAHLERAVLARGEAIGEKREEGVAVAPHASPLTPHGVCATPSNPPSI